MYFIILLALHLILNDFQNKDYHSVHENIACEEQCFEEKLIEGIAYFYDTNWLRSSKIFNELKEINPHDPRPHFFESMKPFLEYFFIDQDSELADDFLSKSAIAIELSKNRLESVNDDTTMVLLLSGLHGYRGLVAAGQSRHRIALSSGLTGFNYTRKLLSLGTDRADAKIGRGMFYYMIGTVPSGMRWATNMFGFRAVVDDGFNELKKAAETENYVRNDALMMLMYLYGREERYVEALHYAEILTNELPENVIFLFKKAELLENSDNNRGAVDVYKRILAINNKSLPRVIEKSRKKINDLEKNL